MDEVNLIHGKASGRRPLLWVPDWIRILMLSVTNPPRFERIGTRWFYYELLAEICEQT